MNDLTPRLAELGDALHEAIRTDLEASASLTRKRRRRLLGLGAAAVLIPTTAIAAGELLSSDDVAKSLPAGTLALVGTEPTCEAVVEQAEYRCVLGEPPNADRGTGPSGYAVVRRDDGLYYRFGGSDHTARPAEPESWLGAAEPTVDSTNHVNGGCRSLDAEGMTWQCYIGEAAVEQDIISPGFLGERVRGPGLG